MKDVKYKVKVKKSIQSKCPGLYGSNIKSTETLKTTFIELVDTLKKREFNN